MNLSLVLDDSDTHQSPARTTRSTRAPSPRHRSPLPVIDLTESPPPSPKAGVPSSPPLLAKIARLKEHSKRYEEQLWEPCLSPVRTSPRRSPHHRRGDHETHSDPETPAKKSTKRKASDDDEEDDLLEPIFSFSSQPIVTAKNSATDVVRKTAKDLAEEKRKRKEEEKQEKASQKEREKQQRKEDKEKYRKRSKEEAAAEMVVKLDRRIIDHRGAELLSQLQKICTASLGDLSLSGLIEWRRKGSPDLEKVFVLRMLGKEFAEMARDGTLKVLVMQIQQQHHGRKLIFLLEGFQEYLRSERVKAQSEYRKRIANNELAVGNVHDQRMLAELKLLLEDTVLWLEVDRQCQVWQTEAPEQSAAWLCTLTIQLGLLPYKPKASFETFCAEAAQKRTYATPMELWQQQLECLNGVSSDIAKAVSRKYPTMGSLLRMYSSSIMTDKEKRELLRQVPLLGADGQPSSKHIGPLLSDKIYRLFTSTNPDEVL